MGIVTLFHLNVNVICHFLKMGPGPIVKTDRVIM